MSVPAGERRIVTVLVADVAESTMIAERLGPERSKFLFDEVVGLMREEVERFDGTVAQLTGDGVLALFGAPTAHEDDAERAVRAALAIQHAMASYADEVGPAYGIDLKARVAVNTGPVVVPDGDAPPDVLYNALGDTVNVAARLQALGDLIAGSLTARQVETAFELEALGELELEGRGEPVAAFRVVEALDAPREAVRTPLVGRDEELTVLEDVFAQLVDGRGAILVIAGEAGIGKSRLMSEARERFRDQVTVLEGHAVAYAQEIPYWPVRELLRDWLALGSSDPEARVRLELKAALTSALEETADEAYPFLAMLLGLSLERELSVRVGELTRDSVQQQTFDAVYRLVCSLSNERPCCLVFEDLQWADEATLALVEALMEAVEDEAVGIVLTYRSEHDHEAWDLADRARRRYRHRFVDVELRALPTQAAVQLAVSAAGAELDATVSALLADRSGGNPFFLEEALYDLVERGVIRRTNGRMEPVNGGDIAVPTLVQEALQARLDRLESDAREVVGVASVVGRSFGTPLLELIVPRDTLRPALADLQRLDLIVEERRRPSPEYRFRHGLVQEVAYGGLVEQRRRELHLLVAQALETVHRDSPEEVYELLALHFSEADDAERAVDYLLKAGDRARTLYAEGEAREHYRRALGFMERTGDQARARETLLKVALTCHLAFDFAGADEAWRRACSLPRETAQAPPTERVEIVTTKPQLPLDPLVRYEVATNWFARNLYRGLLKIERDLSVVPELAEEISVSSDGLVYRFRIRDGAVWSDGVAVGADDFVSAHEVLRTSDLAFLLAPVQSARALDDRTLEVRLSAPTSYFPYLVAEWWNPHPRHNPDAVNGPYQAAELSETHARLVVNATWRGDRGNVSEARISYGAGRDETTAEWRAGRYDLIYELQDEVVSEEHAAEDFMLDVVPSLGCYYLTFAVDRPPFDNALLRRALAHAADLGGLSKAAQNVGGGGLVPPAMPSHSHRIGLDHDLDHARRLLAEAGYPGGRELPELEFAAVHTRGTRELERQWNALGIRVRVVPTPLAEIPSAVAGGAHVWATGFTADYPDPDGFLRGLVELLPGLEDPHVASLLERARRARDRGERLQLYQAIDRWLVRDEVRTVPLWYITSITARRPWVKTWINALMNASLDEIVVER